MSWSDWLYPGNPERREKVIRKSQELIDLMKDNFDATNSLTEIVNKLLHSSFSPITLDEKATVKQNCDVMIKRVNQIQAKVKEVDEELKKKLEPTVYEKLQHMSLQDFNKVSADVKCAVSSVCWVSTAVLECYLVKDIACRSTKIVTGLCGTFVLGLAVDVLVSYLLGSYKQGKLETALAEYEEALKQFRPASEIYQDAINKVRFMLEFLD